MSVAAENNILKNLDGSNFGGINKLVFAPWNAQLNYVANGLASFLQSISWNILEFTMYTVKFTEVFKKNTEGNIYEVSLSGFFPKNRADISALFMQMLNKRFVIGFRDNNNNWIFAGDRNTGLTFTLNSIIDDKVTGRNGYEFQFQGNFRTKSPHFIYEENGIMIQNALLIDDNVYLDYGGNILLYM